MAKYNWADLELKKKAAQYTMFSLFGMLAALFCISGVVTLPSPFWIGLGCMVVAFAFMIMAHKTQGEDKRLKKVAEKRKKVT